MYQNPGPNQCWAVIVFSLKKNSQVGFLIDSFGITQVINVNIKRLGVRQVIKQPVNMLMGFQKVKNNFFFNLFLNLLY
jgi:hypothetical protein